MITLSKISKSFDETEVLKNITTDIKPGKVTAIVGPNGSGKTTLIKLILGLVKLSSGTIEVDGVKVNGEISYKSKIGYMPQAARYPDNLNAMQLLDLIEDIREEKGLRADEMIELFKLHKEIKKPFRNLSGGTKQKVSVMIAMAFNPKILILDEPTAGLDPIASSTFKDLMLKEKSEGKTIILTSHIMSEIQELSDEILFLLEGEIKFSGSIDELLINKNENRLERAIAELMSTQTA